jgi:MOSC domain-containing protein YiiM
MPGTVVAIAAHAAHQFSKLLVPRIELVAGQGVVGDAHCGETVRHRSRVAQDPTQPNLRQVHLLHAELFDALAQQGFDVGAGQLGENITTRGIDLLGLPTDTELAIGSSVRLRLTGLRNPCAQIDAFRPGLLKAVLGRRPDGSLVRKAGVMAVVLAGGIVCAGDPIRTRLPPKPHRPLERV